MLRMSSRFTGLSSDTQGEGGSRITILLGFLVHSAGNRRLLDEFKIYLFGVQNDVAQQGGGNSSNRMLRISAINPDAFVNAGAGE